MSWQWDNRYNNWIWIPAGANSPNFPPQGGPPGGPPPGQWPQPSPPQWQQPSQPPPANWPPAGPPSASPPGGGGGYPTEDVIRQRIRQEEEDRKRAIEDYERRQRKEEEERKQAEKDAVAKYKKKEEDDKAAEEAAWKEHERKEKERKEKEDKKYKERVEEDLGRYGFQRDQIDSMIGQDERRGSNNQLARVTSNKFIRIRRKDIEVETLNAFNVPWGYDSKNNDYYVVYKELSFEETDEMFEHTKKLRKRVKSPKMLEAKPRDVVVRERSKSRDRRRSKSPGLREKFAARVAGID